MSEMGKFTAQGELDVNDQFQNKSWMKRRQNMQGIRLKANFVILEKLKEPLEFLLHSHSNPNREYLSRAAFSLLDIIKDMFNLT